MGDGRRGDSVIGAVSALGNVLEVIEVPGRNLLLDDGLEVIDGRVVKSLISGEDPDVG